MEKCRHVDEYQEKKNISKIRKKLWKESKELLDQAILSVTLFKHLCF